MSNSTYIPQIQDTVPNATLHLAPLNTEKIGLQIERKSIDLGSIERRLSVDSTRIVKPKKVRPIKKTIPYIPTNDSIEHPTFNTLTGKYEITKNKTFQDNFNSDWIKPIEKDSAEIVVVQEVNETINKELIKETITKLEIDNNTKPDKQGFVSTDWMLGIIIVILILFGWIKVAYGRYVQVVVQSAYNSFAARKIQEEGNILRKLVFNFMNVLFFLVIGLFTAQFLTFYHFSFFNLPGIVIFLISVALWVALYSIKGLFLAILDFIFLGKGAFMTYYTTVFIYNKLLSFLLIPIISILPFVPSNITPILFKLGFLAFSTMYIMRLFRGIQTGFKNRLSIFYLILYLCALEILPLTVMIKLIFSFV